MSQSQLLSSIPLVETARPACPMCQAQMLLARIAPACMDIDLHTFECAVCDHVLKTLTAGAVAELVGIEGGVVSGVINLESSGVEASDWRPRHDEQYHEA